MSVCAAPWASLWHPSHDSKSHAAVAGSVAGTLGVHRRGVLRQEETKRCKANDVPQPLEEAGKDEQARGNPHGVPVMSHGKTKKKRHEQTKVRCLSIDLVTLGDIGNK